MIEIVTNRANELAILEIELHNVCNFSCSYCSDSLRNGTNRWREDYTPYIKFIEQVKTKFNHVYVGMLGGEPTLWPLFQEFVNKLLDMKVMVSFNTNASRTLRYWEEFSSGPIFVGLSWHHEEIDDDHYFNVAKTLQNKVDVSALMMITPTQFDRGVALAERLQLLDIAIEPKLVRKSITRSGLMDYTQDQFTKMNALRKYKSKYLSDDYNRMPDAPIYNNTQIPWEDFFKNKMNRFYGWECDAGIKRWVIQPIGNIKRCAAGAGKSLGNVFSEYNLIDTPTICDKEECHCVLDVAVYKRNIIK